MSEPYLLAFNHVTVVRDQQRVLDDFTLSIPTGQHVAILGPNGSGKSTILKLVTRELYPLPRPEASITVLGQDRWLLFDLRAVIGIVSNDLMATCTRRVTGRELVLSGLFGSIGLWPHHVVTPEMERRADEVLAQLELSHLADRRVTHMSSGEARRVLIGRALAHAPKALVLDEPMASLDLRASHDVRDTMRALARADTSLILVTHDLADIVPEIDRVILLQSGRIVRDGRKADVLTSESLSTLFGRAVTVEQHDGFYRAW
jgi:iron complex transport system ATP-binding protein